MSTAFVKSLQTINTFSEWEQAVKTELDIVHSYLNIDEWTKKQTFADILLHKLQRAKSIKLRIMKKYGVKDYKDVVGFRCHICSCVFMQPTALGGHMSKAHPNCRKNQRHEQNMMINESSLQKIKKYEFQNEITRVERQPFYSDNQCQN